MHYICLISDNFVKDKECVSGTEFVTNPRQYNIDPENVWQSLHNNVESDSDKKTDYLKERHLVCFDQHTVHRATPAVSNGWRLFFRASVTTKAPSNEIRNQVQIYVDPNNAGWWLFISWQFRFNV